jgi:hypothetical protein
VGKPTLAELQTKLDGVRREVRNLTVMGMDPKQPPDQAELIKDLEQSARAEMRLRSHTPRASCVLIVRNARTLTRSCGSPIRWTAPNYCVFGAVFVFAAVRGAPSVPQRT